jgi:hypothetical protein
MCMRTCVCARALLLLLRAGWRGGVLLLRAGAREFVHACVRMLLRGGVRAF